MKINNTMKNEYKPKPMDTKDVELGEELEELIEKMAENVHEVWAQTRMNQGWVYGKERNDALKQHPCLVAYEELPESEREYDRNTALETLKLICKLGFKISRE
ncbi:MAG: Ryanodine receptor Ryr [Bacteroidales bacterium]|nr:Ryanodine receptor Ryr [Bacteroidales bacterium]